jgi:hypothetical protein
VYSVGVIVADLLISRVLDAAARTFLEDHVFGSWALATRVVSGEAQYSGGYHWQQLPDPDQAP